MNAWGTQGLTDGCRGKEQDEGVDDGEQGLGDGYYDLAHRLDLAEQPAARKSGKATQ